MRVTLLHPRNDLQRLLDGRLDDARRAALAEHLATCERCRNELDSLRWLGVQLATQRAPLPAPELERRVLAALDAADAATRHRGHRRHRPWGWAVAAAATIVGIGIGLALLLPPRSADFTALAAADLRAVETGRTTLASTATDPAALESWFATAGLDFDLHVYDLSAFGLELIGGRAQRFAGRPSGYAVYRTADGRLVLCEMVRGSLADLPAGGDSRRRDDGLEVRVFARDGKTLAFWQEGPVICFLAASGSSPQQLTTLAFAKAARV